MADKAGHVVALIGPGRKTHTRAHTSLPACSCGAVGGTSCLVRVSWHTRRLVMSGIVPPQPGATPSTLFTRLPFTHSSCSSPNDGGQAGSCSLALSPGRTSNPALCRLREWNFITLKCYVSILLIHELFFFFFFFFLPAHFLDITTTSSADASSHWQSRGIFLLEWNFYNKWRRVATATQFLFP